MERIQKPLGGADEIILVGWIRKGKPADCGETMKNQLLVQRMEQLGVRCLQVDFKDWRRHPWVFAQLLWYMVAHRRATLIFSTSAQNVYPLMRLLRRVGWRQHTIHWVIGGSLGDKVRRGIYRADVIGYMDWTLVESRLMVGQLEACGVGHVLHVPNFKPVTYLPDLSHKGYRPDSGRPLRFVFVSRIMPEKGCDYIVAAARLLNASGYAGRYEIDFYGKVGDNYSDLFPANLDGLEGVNYRGFIDLRHDEGYDRLAAYDVMLFPTYWKGEGFAGVFMDSFIAGVPMIATDWAHNTQFLTDGETAVIIPVHDVGALAQAMRDCIDGRHDLGAMARRCQAQTSVYDSDHVVTPALLESVGIVRRSPEAPDAAR